MDRQHRWWSLPSGNRNAALPEELRRAAEPLLARPAFIGAPLTGVAEAFSRHERAPAEVWVREVRQQVLCMGDEGLIQDERRYALLEVRASAERDGQHAWIQRHHAFQDGAALEAALGTLLEGLPELWDLAAQRTRQKPVTEGILPVLLAPGENAGVLFHELCGHPLEGDVVARGASCLALRRGEHVAGEHVTVLDTPCHGTGAVTYRFDDEGVPARPVTLVREGVVAEPLVDRETASLLGMPANGHGRRVSFRHPPLPRMTHTVIAAHQGDLEQLVSSTEHGLLVRVLTPRHVDLVSGDFSFYVVEGQEIVRGKVGGFIGPTLLRGNILDALAGIDAVGADSATYFAVGGCGKLDHGLLPISFENPTVRIQGLRVSPWR